MKIPSSITKLLENKYVLYFVFFLALSNIFGYMVTGNIKAISLFILIGYLVYSFNKNMIIVLIVPLLLTSIFMSSKLMVEGNENMGKTTPQPNIPDKNKENKEIITPTEAEPEKSKPIPDDSSTEQVKPDDVPPPTSGMTTMYKKNNRIDYASTVEDAYGDLNKILGGDGIKRLTDDTQKLMGQQMQLAEAMKSMTPLLTQAKTLMGGLDMKQFGDITNIAKQFGVK